MPYIYSSSSLSFGSFNEILISTSTAHHSSAIFGWNCLQLDQFLRRSTTRLEQQLPQPRETCSLKTFAVINIIYDFYNCARTALLQPLLTYPSQLYCPAYLF